MSAGRRLQRHFDGLSAAEQGVLLRKLTPAMRRDLMQWRFLAHDGQLAPEGDGWRVWVIQAGRGFGKTRAGAEWVTDMALAGDAATRIALVGATLEDAKRVMVEGPSGVLAVARTEKQRPAWRVSTGVVRWANGAVAQVYGAAGAETLRGPEHGYAWADELGKWRGGAAWTIC